MVDKESIEKVEACCKKINQFNMSSQLEYTYLEEIMTCIKFTNLHTLIEIYVVLKNNSSPKNTYCMQLKKSVSQLIKLEKNCLPRPSKISIDNTSKFAKDIDEYYRYYKNEIN